MKTAQTWKRKEHIVKEKRLIVENKMSNQPASQPSIYVFLYVCVYVFFLNQSAAGTLRM